MRILVLSKRQYMGKDLLDDKFFRFREIPLALARRGHTVVGSCLSYKKRPEIREIDRCVVTGASVEWNSINLGALKIPGLIQYLRQCQRQIDSFDPDFIWAGSDSLYGIIGVRLRPRRALVVFDLYDDFSMFSSAGIPGVLPLYRRALRQCAGITTFSARLATKVKRLYFPSSPIITVENGVRTDLFHPNDKLSCRERLKLSPTDLLIGMAGSLDSNRSVKLLISAFEQLRSHHGNLKLILAGPLGAGVSLPTDSGICYLGALPHTTIPYLIGALDVVIISFENTARNECAIPTRLSEAISCRVPFVCAKVGESNEILADFPNNFYKSDSVQDLVSVVQRQIEARSIVDIAVPSWDETTIKVESLFLGLLAR